MKTNFKLALLSVLSVGMISCADIDSLSKFLLLKLQYKIDCENLGEGFAYDNLRTKVLGSNRYPSMYSDDYNELFLMHQVTTQANVELHQELLKREEEKQRKVEKRVVYMQDHRDECDAGEVLQQKWQMLLVHSVP